MQTWQILLSCYLVLGTAAYLIRRKLAVLIPEHNRFVNWFYFLGVLYPVGLIAALITQPNLHIGWQNFAILLVGELIFPIVNVLAYRANENVDAGLFTIINNLTPVITIVTAWILLHEGLDSRELIGAFIILASTLIVSLPNFLHRSKSKRAGLFIAFISVALLGFGITFEKYMLGRVEFGAYLVYGWGLQAMWMTIIAWPERRNLYLLKKRALALPIAGYGLTNAFKGLCFVGALRLSGNVSLVSAFSSFLAVMVVVSAYFALKEREWFALKIGGAVLGVIGLIVLNS